VHIINVLVNEGQGCPRAEELFGPIKSTRLHQVLSKEMHPSFWDHDFIVRTHAFNGTIPHLQPFIDHVFIEDAAWILSGELSHCM
jgi:membrane glycosyltransferase